MKTIFNSKRYANVLFSFATYIGNSYLIITNIKYSICVCAHAMRDVLIKQYILQDHPHQLRHFSHPFSTFFFFLPSSCQF